VRGDLKEDRAKAKSQRPKALMHGLYVKELPGNEPQGGGVEARPY